MTETADATLELPPPPARWARARFGPDDATPLAYDGPAGPGPHEDEGPAGPETGPTPGGPAGPGPVRAHLDRARAHYATRWARGPAGLAEVWARRARWIAGPVADQQWALDSYRAAAKAGQAQYIREHAELEARARDEKRARARRRLKFEAVTAGLIVLALAVLFLRAPLLLCLVVVGLAVVGPYLLGRQVPVPGPLETGPGPADDAPPETGPTLDKTTLTEAFTEAGVIKAGQELYVWQLRPEVDGWSCKVRLPGAVTYARVIAKASEIAAVLGTDDTCLSVEQVKGRNGDVYVRIYDEDPMAAAPRVSHLPDLHELDYTRGVPYAHARNGEPIKAVFGRGSLLVAGEADSGKTLTARSMLAGLTLDSSVQLIIGDPQGLGGWAPFAAVGKVFAGLADDVVEALTCELEALIGVEYPRRQRIVERARDRDPLAVTEAKITRAMTRDREAGTPYIVVVLDEFHRYFDTDQGKRLEDVCVALFSTGRAFAITGVGITQYPVEKNVPVRILTLFQNRIAHACSTDQMATGALGYSAWKRQGVDPTKLEATTHAGAHWARGGMFEPRGPGGNLLARADYNDDQAIARILAKARDLRLAKRPELLPMPAAPEQLELKRGDTLPDHLLEVLDAEHADQATSLILLAGLRRNHPARYGHLGDRQLNTVGKDWGLKAHTLGRGPGYKCAGLTRAEVEAVAPGRDTPLDAQRDPVAT